MKSPVLCPTCGTPDRSRKEKDAISARCGKCGTELFPEGSLPVTDDTFQRIVTDSPLPVLLDLWAPWCGSCHQIAPILEDLSRKYHGRLRVAKLDIEENPYTATQMEAIRIPLLLFMRNGTVVSRLVGVYPASEIENGLRTILSLPETALPDTPPPTKGPNLP